MEIRAVDYHTAGEPFRIVTGGVELPRGATILDKRRDALERLDHVRRLLVHEPRGHADMYGCFVVEPDDDERRPRRRLLPQRRLLDRVRPRDDRARHVGARRGHRRAAGGREPRRRRRALGPARHLGARRGRPRALGALPQRAVVRLGARASSSASARSTSRSAAPSTPPLEERVEPGELPRLIELGRELKRELEAWQDVVHPLEPELRDVYGVIFWQEEGESPLTQRNVTVFADGEVDRSPCGSGTSARLALLDRYGSPAARRGALSPQHRRHGVHWPRRAATPRSRASPRWSPRSRAARTARASTSSRSIRATHSATASCSAERVSKSGRTGMPLESLATCFPRRYAAPVLVVPWRHGRGVSGDRLCPGADRRRQAALRPLREPGGR